VLFHCYALDNITHFLFGSRALHSINDPADQELMGELLYHESHQCKATILALDLGMFRDRYDPVY
jgi:hypothetical protein